MISINMLVKGEEKRKYEQENQLMSKNNVIIINSLSESLLSFDTNSLSLIG